MSITAQEENARMLAAVAGITPDQAARRLDVTVAISFDDNDAQARLCAEHIHKLMSRTVRHVSVNSLCRAAPVVEIVIGRCEARYGVNSVHSFIAGENRVVVSRAETADQATTYQVHPIALLLAACYSCALALKSFLGDAIPYPCSGTIVVDLNELYPDEISRFSAATNVDVLTLAGAGAIGNGLIYALAQFSVRGRVDVSDNDSVSAGNLQRCVLFEDKHLGVNKSEAFCSAGQPLLPGLTLVPYAERVEALRDSKDPHWLRRLVVAVDSRGARRRLQSEIAGEVFDASTTGIQEVVLHYHKEPNSGACLACSYWEVPEEAAHEQHIAKSLGVRLDEVRGGHVSPQAAAAIAATHREVAADSIIGLPFDTVFKQVICSSAKIAVGEAESVLAPFAFASVLAGAYLAIEVVRRTIRPRDDWNLWKLSPWTQPLPALRRFNPRNEKCEFCSKPELLKVAHEIWSERPRSVEMI